MPLPLQLNAAMYYLLFFYWGYLFQRNNINFDKFYTSHSAITLVLTFAVLFPSLTLLRENVEVISLTGGRGYLAENLLIAKLADHSIMNISKMIYSAVGLAMLFVIVGIIEKHRTSSPPQWMVNAGGLCMGVYLFQQFILMWLYHYTKLPSFLGFYWLPWLGFIVALAVSISLSYLMRLTKVGRFLIG